MTGKPCGDDALRIVGLPAEPERLKVFAAVALGLSGFRTIVEVTGLEERAVGRALARLAAGELIVENGPGGYRVAVEDLKGFVRAAVPPEEEVPSTRLPMPPASSVRSLAAAV